jgi:hypothetical protein
MEIISSHEFDAFCHRDDLTLLKSTYNRPKLFESVQGDIVKIFYPRKKRFSSNKFKPYAIRFHTNAKRLQSLGFQTPIIKTMMHCPELNTYILSYKKLPGVDLRVLTTRGQPKELIDSIASFIVNLHTKGIFFRSVHLENLLQLNSGDFALLDIVDVQFKRRPLSLFLRYRNLKHMFQIKDDVLFWSQLSIADFLKSYFKFANLPFFKKTVLTTLLLKLQ